MSEQDQFATIRRIGGERYQAFLDCGYREWYSPGGPMLTPYLLQRKVMSKGKALFVVNVWVYDRSRDPGWSVGIGIQPEAQFKLLSGGVFNVTLLEQDWTPGQIERFFAAIYDRMECVAEDE